MLSRRRFLGSAALASAGIAAPSIALCDSEVVQRHIAKLQRDRQAGKFIKLRQKLLASADPKQFLGYPVNLNWPSEGFLAWQKELGKVEVGIRSLNNVGDPFYDPSWSSHYLEADLIKRFGERFGFAKNNLWGFLSNSGTDSNLHGAYIGRTLLFRKTGVMPKIYYTREAHYSVQVIRDLLNLDGVLVSTNTDGGMSAADLKQKARENADAPVLIMSTIGTTLKGAVDDIDAIRQALAGYETYFHLDAALFGGYLHATEYADSIRCIRDGQKRYDSIAVSCHKFFGFNAVAGIFVVHKDTFEEFRGYFADAHDPAYISHVPGTITCSRDPIKPATFHYYCTDESIAQQQADAMTILENADYLRKEMQNHFPELEASRSNEQSNTIYFRRVHQDIVKKWTLAVVDNSANPEPSYAHVVVMPHASKKLLDRFLEDLSDYRANLLYS